MNKLVPIVLALAVAACARTQPQPAVMALDAPQGAAPSASDAAPRALAEAEAPARDAGRTVKLSFRVTDQDFRRDPKTGKETYHTTLELTAATDPPLKIAIGSLEEPGCRLAYDGAEFVQGDDVLGGLVCYHAGYGDYVLVKREPGGRLSVVTYGQSEALIGNENPPRKHERTLGRIALPPGARTTFELVDPDGGVILP